MAIKTIEIKKEHLQLISNMEIKIDKELKTIWFDEENPYGRGDDRYIDMSLILGFFNQREVKDDGISVYSDDKIELMDNLHEEICNNIEFYLDIILQNSLNIIEPGVYKTKLEYRDWKKVN